MGNYCPGTCGAQAGLTYDTEDSEFNMGGDFLKK